LIAIAMLSCRKSTDMATDNPTGSATAGVVPTVILGPDFAPAAFAPGRYVTAIQRMMQGTHAMQVLLENSTSSFLLELAADGAATACRGSRYLFRNNGPGIHTEERYREQQGYRGRYAVVDGVAEVTLVLDNAVCPHVFEGELALPRAPTVKLRCVLATPHGTNQISVPVLLCRPTYGPPDARPEELDPQVVEQLAPPGWFLLGSGNGLRVRVTGRPVGAHVGDPVMVTVKVADAPLGANAWQQEF
jgi:hypothetical protein